MLGRERGARRRTRACELLDRVGLAEHAEKYPGQPVRRPAAARRHRPRARHGPDRHAVRRADLGARPGDDQRGARRHGRARPRRHDHDGRHPRDGFCPQGRATASSSWTAADRRGQPARTTSSASPRTERAKVFLSKILRTELVDVIPEAAKRHPESILTAGGYGFRDRAARARNDRAGTVPATGDYRAAWTRKPHQRRRSSRRIFRHGWIACPGAASTRWSSQRSASPGSSTGSRSRLPARSRGRSSKARSCNSATPTSGWRAVPTSPVRCSARCSSAG